MTTDPTDVVRDLDDIGGVFKALKEIRVRKAEVAEAERAVVEQIKAKLGSEGTVGCVGGVPVVTWRWSQPGHQIDVQALKADHPEIFEKYYTEKQPSRPLKILEGPR